MRWLCRLGIHARVDAAEASAVRWDLVRCRRCPAQWRIGSYGYSWGRVGYRDRIADASGPYDHDTAVQAEEAQRRAFADWFRSRRSGATWI